MISPDNFYNSDTEALIGINGIYGDLRVSNLYGRTAILIPSFGTDEIISSRNFGGTLPLMNYTLSQGNRGWIDQIWNDGWRLISDVNAVISSVENNEALSLEIRDQVVGEALFLRALMYYHLTHLWGDVPYYRESLPLNEVQELSKTAATTIISDLVTDLQAAGNMLPSAYDASDEGRATRWAAKTLLMKLMLWQNDWSGAETTGRDIIDNSPHVLLPDFASVFDKNDDAANAEVIFKTVYTRDLGTTPLPDFFIPRLNDEPANSDDKQALRDALAANGDGFTGFGLAIPSPGFINSLAADDTRTPLNFTQEYEGIPLNFPYSPKFQNLDQVESPRANHGDDVIIFRLADVYLMLAEALNEQGKTGDALSFINPIRQRAYEPDRPDLAGLDQSAIRDVLWDERRWELYAEGHRRYDLVRWGRLVETVQGADYGPLFDGPANIQPHHVLMPIPPTTIELAPQLDQNSGY